MSNTSSNQIEEADAKYSHVRGVRREGQATRAKRNQPRTANSSRGRQPRTVIVRGQLRDKPDIKRLARAAVQHALAEAEKESQRIAALESESHARDRTTDEGDRV